jgi:myo-inositol 2-dehydrogenase/D-chiro-inositol 1-dehydrogenase
MWDAVLIATPEFLHAEQVMAAAAAGKHVLCEKPMARSLGEADAMLDACKRASVCLMIGHSRRFTKRYMEIHQALIRGEIGTVRVVRENERRTRAHMGQAGIRWTPKHWTGDPALELGVALTHGIHEADLLRWFIGSAPVAVFAEHSVNAEGNVGVPDFLTFTVRFADGAVGSTEISNCAPPGYPAFHQLELYGTEGAIRAKDHDLVSLVRYHDEGTEFPDSYEILLHNVTAYARQLAEFIDAVRGERPPMMTPDEARAALALALAALESATIGQPVKIPSPPVGL